MLKTSRNSGETQTEAHFNNYLVPVCFVRPERRWIRRPKWAAYAAVSDHVWGIDEIVALLK